MKEIEEFLSAAKAELDRNSQGASMVGNRPQYPMLLLFNRPFGKDALQAIFSKVVRVWPQSAQHIPRFRYVLTGGDPQFLHPEDGTDLSDDALLTAIDDEQRKQDVFGSMMELLAVNIVDTSEMNGDADFDLHYRMIDRVARTVNTKMKTMLILLLNDSNRNRSAADAIRAYLSETQSRYDSTILIATRTRNNQAYEIRDLYRIVSDLLVLCNNNAVTSADDEDYRSRYALLFNGGTFTVSHVPLERPNDKIAQQICEVILDEARAAVAEQPRLDLTAWNKLLGFDNGRSALIEQFIGRQDIRPDTSALSHLPMKAAAVEEKHDLLQLPFRKFRSYSFPDSVSLFSDDYCRNYVAAQVDFLPCTSEFERWIRANVSPAQLAGLEDGTLNQIIDLLNPGTVNEDLPLDEYFRRQIEVSIRKTILFPQFKNVLRRLRDNARNVVRLIEEIRARFQESLLLDRQKIGVLYFNLTKNFFKTEPGINALRAICDPGSTKGDIFRALQACFSAVVKENRSVFALPFIEEWEKRLDTTGDRIYREISSELTETADNRVHLYGNLPVHRSMTVFMLHTVDRNGENPTRLYSHLRETFRGDAVVQYFNTGYDDALVSLSFIPCEGRNIII